MASLKVLLDGIQKLSDPQATVSIYNNFILILKIFRVVTFLLPALWLRPLLLLPPSPEPDLDTRVPVRSSGAAVLGVPGGEG